jgi:tetratricopeptide (TPR) repeat protein
MTPRILRSIAIAVVLVAPMAVSSARHDAWVEVRSPNFVVACNAGEKQARKAAVQFEQIRAVFRRSLPFTGTHPSPVLTILAVKNEDSMRELLPEYWVKGHMHPAGLFAGRMNQLYAAVNLDAPGDNPYQTIYHEYFHALTLPYYPGLPLWVAEGLADFFGNTQLGPDHVMLGVPDRSLIQELRQERPIPLETLFRVDHSSPYYNESNKTSVFYAESWALTHYMMVGDRESHRPAFQEYLNALGQGQSQQQAALKAFGDLKKLELELQRYMGNATYYVLKSGPAPKIPDSDLQVRPLGDAEADAFKAGFFWARGRYDEARPLLAQAAQLDPQIALVQQNLALVEFAEHRREQALQAASRAIELDPQKALTRFLRAFLALSGSGNGEHGEQIEDDLRTAISLSPEFAPPYGVLAVHLLSSDDKLPEALALAQKAVSLEPGNGSYQFDLAQVLARMRRFDEAQIAGLRARAAATEPEERLHTEQFLQYLEQARQFPESSVTVAVEERSPAGEAPPTPAEIPALRRRAASGASITAEGMASAASCTGNEMRVTFVTKSGTAYLHASDFERVDLELDVAFDPKGYRPCTQLQGHNAAITYTTVAGKPYDGEIQRIEVER